VDFVAFFLLNHHLHMMALRLAESSFGWAIRCLGIGPGITSA
jgi:hypothetical protein